MKSLILAAFVSCFAAAIVLSLALNSMIASPLRKLTHTMTAITQRRQASPEPLTDIGEESDSNRGSICDGDEFANLRFAFDQMLREIKKHEHAMKEHQRTLEQRVKERTLELLGAKTASQNKSEFIANISHEIRTPIHGILSFATFGIDEAETSTSDELRRYFEQIDSNGQSLLSLVNKLLDLAKLESGKVEFEFEPTDPFVLISAVVRECESLCSERQIRIYVDHESGPGEVWLDQRKTEQVVRNVVTNAIKFSPSGGVIQVAIHGDEEFLRVSVRDEGPGVPEDEIEAVFDKFVQSSATKTGAGGSGLGLAICQELVAGHNGRIWVENRASGGALFTFEIPRMQAAVEGKLEDTTQLVGTA